MKSSMKYFAAIAFLFLAFALSGNLTTARGGWVFKENRVFNNMGAGIAQITSERYDVTGGSVDINLSGDILSFCPGGYEKVRFTWNFANGISEITPGGGISASLDARQISKSQNCGTQLASRSLMYIYGGSFALEGNSSVDRERFQSGNGFRAIAAEYVNSGTATLRVNTNPFEPSKPLAYFEVCITTPTRSGGGFLCYAYVYEYKSGGGGGGASEVTVEYDTDRMYEDYKDYDLPRADFELCRKACAADGNCKAYTYVKPGVQGASARCWLKSGTPVAASNSCCISGVKKP